MQSVILHIGHGKTGSSYLQSLLASNISLLNRHDISYPHHKSLDAAKQGKISSGNSRQLFSSQLGFEGRNNLLFSGESLFRELLSGELLLKLSKNYNLKVVLFTRDIVEHAVSRWTEGVKRGGVIKDLDSFLMNNPIGPHPLVVDWIRKSEQLGFTLIIRNYSRWKNNLADVFCLDTFDGKISNLESGSIKTVNRGLTLSEYNLQRIFNAIEGKKSSFYISDFVVNKFPNTKPTRMLLSEKTYDFVTKKNAPYLDQINRRLDSAEHISFGSELEYVQGKTSNDLMSNEVINAIAKSITAHANLKNPPKAKISDLIKLN